MKRLHVALVQQSCQPAPFDNLACMLDGVHEAADAGAKLVLLPELHNSPYFCQTEDAANFALAEPIPGPSTQRLSEAAAARDIVIVGSLFERRAAGLYHNTAVVLDGKRGLVGRYRKMHIPDDPGYHEKYYFTPGDLGFTPIDTSVGRLGLLVCWDQWYPEAARLMALAGADILLYPTAIGFDPADTTDEQARQLDAWITIQRSHAIANHLPLLAANRCGFEADPSKATAGASFWGNSFICGPQGEILAQAETAARILSAELDLSRTEQLRQVWPYFRDRRIDAYAPLTTRWRD